MVTALVTFAAFALMMLAMAVGVMAGRKPLKGSCGGAGGDCACEKSGKVGACERPGALPGSAAMAAPGAIMKLRGLPPRA